MKIKVTTSLAGVDFDYQAGSIVDLAEFKAAVGSGFENLSVPYVERAVKPQATKETR